MENKDINKSEQEKHDILVNDMKIFIQAGLPTDDKDIANWADYWGMSEEWVRQCLHEAERS